jgi:hypothetical protein
MIQNEPQMSNSQELSPSSESLEHSISTPTRAVGSKRNSWGQQSAGAGNMISIGLEKGNAASRNAGNTTASGSNDNSQRSNKNKKTKEQHQMSALEKLEVDRVKHNLVVARTKKLCFELGGISAKMKELDCAYEKSSVGEHGEKWFVKHREIRGRWMELTNELGDIERELSEFTKGKKPVVVATGTERMLKQSAAAASDVVANNSNDSNLESTMLASSLWEDRNLLLRYIRFALQRSRPTTMMSDLRDAELCDILERLVESHGVKHVLALSLVSKQFARCIRSPLVWKTVFDLSREVSISDRDLLTIIKNDDAFTLCKHIRLDGCKYLTDRSISKLVRKAGKSLESVSLVGCLGVTYTVVETITKHCPNINHINVRDCENLDAGYVLNQAVNLTKLRDLNVKGCGCLRGRVPLAKFIRFTVDLEIFREEEDKRFEKANGFKYHATIEANGGSFFKNNDENVTFEERLKIRKLEKECICDLNKVDHLTINTRDKIGSFQAGDVVSACEHAAEAQHGNPFAVHRLVLLPKCGHVLCGECELSCRRQMVTIPGENGTNEYTYPCPACNENMPEPGGFQIELLRNNNLN